MRNKKKGRKERVLKEKKRKETSEEGEGRMEGKRRKKK